MLNIVCILEVGGVCDLKTYEDAFKTVFQVMLNKRDKDAFHHPNNKAIKELLKHFLRNSSKENDLGI